MRIRVGPPHSMHCGHLFLGKADSQEIGRIGLVLFGPRDGACVKKAARLSDAAGGVGEDASPESQFESVYPET